MIFELNLEEGTVKSIKALAVASITTLFFTSSTIAAVALPTGWYAEGNVGTGKTNVSMSGTSVSDTGFGWGLNAGYKFMPFFAAEIGYTHYPIAYAKVSGVKVAKDTLYSYDIAGKGILPFSDSGFELFAKLGLSRAYSHIVNTNPNVALIPNTGTKTATNYIFGVGCQYSFMPNLSANLQWNRVKGKNSINDLDLLSVGLAYIFS